VLGAFPRTRRAPISGACAVYCRARDARAAKSAGPEVPAPPPREPGSQPRRRRARSGTVVVQGCL